VDVAVSATKGRPIVGAFGGDASKRPTRRISLSDMSQSRHHTCFTALPDTFTSRHYKLIPPLRSDFSRTRAKCLRRANRRCLLKSGDIDSHDLAAFISHYGLA